MHKSTKRSDAMHVLLIEGHPQVRKPLQQLLLSRGHQVSAVGSAEEGLRAISGRRYDTVVCNHQLPGISGMEFFSRAHRALAKTTTILTASIADDYLANDALATGITVFMEMPFKIDNLLAFIEGRYQEICAGALGRHLYVTSAGQMVVVSPAQHADRSRTGTSRQAPRQRTINHSGRQWKLYLNPDAPHRSQERTGADALRSRNRNPATKRTNPFDFC